VAQPMIIKNTYVPKVGEGRALLEALREASGVWREAGFPAMELWKPFHGPHNAVTTIQRWPSIGEWEAARARVVQTPSLVSVVFDRIYPTNLEPYDTDLFEVME
jgi:hypothetical protein